MPFVRALFGLLLWPLCMAVLWTLLTALGWAQAQGSGLATWENAALAGGFLGWLILFLAFPPPMRSYILAHELTHAIWALAMGGRVGRLRVNARGGSVDVSNGNIFVTLAPYFFPLYTWGVLAVWGLLGLFVDQTPFRLPWLALLGASWSFHVTFTVSALAGEQPDVRQVGGWLAYPLIVLANGAGLLLWVVAVLPPTLGQTGKALGQHLLLILSWLWGNLLQPLGAWGLQLLQTWFK